MLEPLPVTLQESFLLMRSRVESHNDQSKSADTRSRCGHRSSSHVLPPAKCPKLNRNDCHPYQKREPQGGFAGVAKHPFTLRGGRRSSLYRSSGGVVNRAKYEATWSSEVGVCVR
jgi:hypothetical protein